MTGQTSPSFAFAVEGWSGGRTDETVPTTGQMASSMACCSGRETILERAGHDSAFERSSELVKMPGCLLRLWWWSVVALVTGQTSPGAERSSSGCLGGRTVLVVPTMGQTSAMMNGEICVEW